MARDFLSAEQKETSISTPLLPSKQLPSSIPSILKLVRQYPNPTLQKTPLTTQHPTQTPSPNQPSFKMKWTPTLLLALSASSPALAQSRCGGSLVARCCPSTDSQIADCASSLSLLPSPSLTPPSRLPRHRHAPILHLLFRHPSLLFPHQRRLFPARGAGDNVHCYADDGDAGADGCGSEGGSGESYGEGVDLEKGGEGRDWSAEG